MSMNFILIQWPMRCVLCNMQINFLFGNNTMSDTVPMYFNNAMKIIMYTEIVFVAAVSGCGCSLYTIKYFCGQEISLYKIGILLIK